jgi:hypothetical protein
MAKRRCLVDQDGMVQYGRFGKCGDQCAGMATRILSATFVRASGSLSAGSNRAHRKSTGDVFRIGAHD